MKSIKQQYIDLKEGRMTQAQFMRNVRMSMPQYITNITSFNDTVKILKNKGILTEEVNTKDKFDVKMQSGKEYKGVTFINSKNPNAFKTSDDKIVDTTGSNKTVKKVNELGFTNEPVSSDEALLSIITKYISDPDEAQQELEAYRQKGYTGFSDPLIANLARDEEFQSWVQQGHDEETLEKYAEGLIATSGCINGKVPKLLLAGKEKEAEETALKYEKWFVWKLQIDPLMVQCVRNVYVFP
jgi:hypothetical protein